MPSKSVILSAVTLIVICGFVATTAPAFASDKEKVLYSFCSQADCTDGQGPYSGLILDAAGNWYGTTRYGGANGNGVAFELSPGVDGTWTEKVLHSFCSSKNCRDGLQPMGGLVSDALGNLYGTTYYACGTIFELKRKPDGTWVERVLHNFGINRNDACGPIGNLVPDANGNLYGTTVTGGVDGMGAVFELSRDGRGRWTEKVLYSFVWKTGVLPEAGLTIDSSGNLYGTASGGGDAECGYNKTPCGTVFELSRTKGGGWKERTLHSFNGTDGSSPWSNLVFDSQGDLYGTTALGGAYGLGTVFKLIRGANGEWTERVLRSFHKDRYPLAGLVLDGAGNLYGATAFGGRFKSEGYCYEGCGTAFELSPDANGGWAETTLHSFGNRGDGASPEMNLVIDGSGNIYGTTVYGGAYGCGTVLEITP